MNVAMNCLQEQIDDLSDTAGNVQGLTSKLMERCTAAEAERDQYRRNYETMANHAADLAAALASKE